MSVSWFTVIAQIGNFLVLVWLLQHFLYRPVIDAMDRREARIAARLHAARELQEAAGRELESYREHQAQLHSSQAQRLQDGRDAAAAERRRLERLARDEVERSRVAWLAELQSERSALLIKMREQGRKSFWRLAGRALDSLANATLEDQIAQVFADRIAGLESAPCQLLATAAAEAKSVTIHSRFPVNAAARARIEHAVASNLGPYLAVEYETSPAAPCGLTLQAGSQSLAWGFDAYLDEFMAAVDASLAQPSEAAHGPLTREPPVSRP